MGVVILFPPLPHPLTAAHAPLINNETFPSTAAADGGGPFLDAAGKKELTLASVMAASDRQL